MLSLKKIVLRRGTKIVLSQATVTLQAGEKVGLIGRNGAGKSSLFALITGQLQEDQGEWTMPDGWQISQVEQHIPETEQGATDFVLEGDLRLNQVLADLKAAESQDDGEAMALAYAALDDAGGHHARSRAQAMLLGLGFKSHELDNPVNSFSGGWRMRLQLSRALMCPADLMLLDEPTNHLDLDALVWLEDWLKRYEGTLLVISHDRDFLDAVTRVTLHLDNAQLTRYGGNYSAFEVLLAQQQALQQSAYEKQQDRVAHLQRFIDRFKAKASKAKQAQSRVKALERMQRIDAVIDAADFQFEFKPPESLPNPMLSLQNASLGYVGEQGSTAILKGVGLSVLAGQRIGILGANGQGKSTLVKTIAGDLKLISGDMVEGKGLRIGYFAQQELDVLKPDDSPLQHLIDLSRKVSPQAREQELRNFLGGFRFVDGMVGQAVGTLSGGEKARLVLAMLVWQRPNLLLLDEPTNHLDLVTRESLGMALNGFDGTVLLVSHDRSLLRAVCDEFWVVSQGKVQSFAGDLDDYQRMVADQAAGKTETTASNPKAAAKPVNAPNHPSGSRSSRQRQAQMRQDQSVLLKPLKAELLALEKTMQLHQAEWAGMETQMLKPLTGPEISELGRKMKQQRQQMDQAEERWLALSEELEALQQAKA
jgi:ATP-binding cassette, subfamily F, member 3